MMPMNPRRGSVPGLQTKERRRYSGLAVLAQSLLASLVLVGGVGSAQYFVSGGTPWFLHQSGDAVDPVEANARAAAFAALKPLPLSLVPAADIAGAIDGMNLSAAEKAAMVSNFQTAAPQANTRDVSAPAAAPQANTRDVSAPAAAPQANTGDVSAPAAAPQANTGNAPAQAIAPAHLSQPAQHNRLAWITLWDTDAEDGDAVRIDSQGYSRTVTLAKQPVTFAIPVPLDGVVKVTGIRDGEGGGITVGFASGASRAAFPIMSVGQTLGLNVRLD
jgi:hypothetical protein